MLQDQDDCLFANMVMDHYRVCGARPSSQHYSWIQKRENLLVPLNQDLAAIFCAFWMTKLTPSKSCPHGINHEYQTNDATELGFTTLAIF